MNFIFPLDRIITTEKDNGHYPNRIGVIAYLPNNVQKMYELNMMLYGSWKYLTTKRKIFYQDDISRNLIDLMIFYDLEMEEHIPIDCQMFRYFGNETNSSTIQTPTHEDEFRELFKAVDDGNDMKINEREAHEDDNDGIIFDSACWRIPQVSRTFENLDHLSPFDNYLLYFREGIDHILKEYSHIIHVNTDIVLTPMLFTTNLNKVRSLEVGMILNCDESRKMDIKRFSKVLGLKDQHKPCASYSVLGRTNIVIKLLQMVFKVGKYISLETIMNPNQEARDHNALLVAKDLLIRSKRFVDEVFTFIDSSTCSPRLNIYKVLNIVVADDIQCVFNKINFFNHLTNLQTLSPKEKEDFRSNAGKDLTQTNIKQMNIADFAQFIAYKYAAEVMSNVLGA